MALERRIDTDTWDDNWFSALPPDGKLLFLYLLTNSKTTSCGAYEITIRKMAFDTGLTIDRVDDLLASFGERVQWFDQREIVFVRNFYRRQKPNPSYTQNAQRAVAALPADVRDRVCAVYPELRTGSLSMEAEPETPSTHPVPTLYPEGGSALARASKAPVLAPVPVTEPELEPERDETRVTAPPQPVMVDSAFAVYSGFVEEVSPPDFKPAPRWKEKQLGIAKRLLEQGYGADKVRRCVVFMRSQTWRTDPFDLGSVEKYIGTWEVNGEPEREQPKHRPGETGRATGTSGATGNGRDPDVERRGYDYDEVIRLRAVGR